MDLIAIQMTVTAALLIGHVVRCGIDFCGRGKYSRFPYGAPRGRVPANHGAANSRSTCSPRLRQRVNLKFKSAASARGFTYA
jgi:hypothetical protein